MRNCILISAVLSSILILCSCDIRKKKAIAAEPPPPNVLYIQAAKQEIAKSVEFIAQTVAEESVDIIPMVEGYLVKQCFDEGTMVKKGDLLFEIDPRPFEAQVKNAEGQLLSAKAQLVSANIEFNRYTTLLSESATTQKDLDNITMKKGTAEGQLLIAEASLETAKINLDYTKLRAPFDGKISVCPISIGNLVGPGTNKNVLTSLMRMDPMKVEFNVPETAVVTLLQKYGDLDNARKLISAEIVLPNGTLYNQKGAIYFIDNQITANTGTIKQRARFPNPESLLTPNEYVRIRLIAKQKQDVILIPQTAIQDDITGKFVMSVKDGKAMRSQIKTGNSYGSNIEILSGITEGDWIITEGLLKVRQGITVNAKLDPAGSKNQ